MPAAFVPKIWAAKLLAALEKAHVFASPMVVNRDYEGEINNLGDSVEISTVGDITIGDYDASAGDLGTAERVTGTGQTLIIDQGKFFNFAVQDVARLQSKPEFASEVMRRAGYGLRDVADLYVAATMAAAVASANKIGSISSPKTDVSKTTAYEYLVDLGVILDNSSTPEEGRFVVVPSWFHGLLLKDDRFVSTGTSSGDTVRASGVVGEAAGFTVLKSQNYVKATATTAHRIMAGHNMATSYADQIRKVESIRNPSDFGDIVRGLHLYGCKVVRPENLAVLIANPA